MDGNLDRICGDDFTAECIGCAAAFNQLIDLCRQGKVSNRYLEELGYVRDRTFGNYKVDGAPGYVRWVTLECGGKAFIVHGMAQNVIRCFEAHCPGENLPGAGHLPECNV